jgi:hypothetical protein
MLRSCFVCHVVVLLLLWATPGDAAEGAADHQTERLNVKRLANGYLAITAVQQVRGGLLFLALKCFESTIAKIRYTLTFCQFQVALSYTGDRPTFFDQFPRPLAQVALIFTGADVSFIRQLR